MWFIYLLYFLVQSTSLFEKHFQLISPKFWNKLVSFDKHFQLIECLVNMQVMSNGIYKALDDRVVINALYKTLTSLSVWKYFLGRCTISIVQFSCYSWEYVECWTSILCLILLILWSIIVKFVFSFNQFV